MPVAAEAILEDHDGRFALRFERRLAHSPERVWRALTEPDELAAWHPTPANIEPEVGGAVSFDTKGKPIEMADGEVTEYDPPKVLAYTWGEGDHLRWELSPEESGCLLVLVHTFDDRFKAARDAAGWDICLESLTATLDGRPPYDSQDPDTIPPEWKGLNRAYQERFGISPDEATPPPAGMKQV